MTIYTCDSIHVTGPSCFLTCCSSTSPTLLTTVSSPSLALKRFRKSPTLTVRNKEQMSRALLSRALIAYVQDHIYFLRDHITVIAFIAHVQDQIIYIVVTSESF